MKVNKKFLTGISCILLILHLHAQTYEIQVPRCRMENGGEDLWGLGIQWPFAATPGV